MIQKTVHQEVLIGSLLGSRVTSSVYTMSCNLFNIFHGVTDFREKDWAVI